MKILKQLDRFSLVLIVSITFAISLTGCFINRSGTSQLLPIDLDILPTYLCEGEEVNVLWEYMSPIDRRDNFTLLLTRRPGGPLGIPRPHPAVGSTSFSPNQPSLPAEIAETAITFTAILRRSSGSISLNTNTANTVVIGSTANQPHLESFEWGCDNARGGGVGWSSVNYERGQIATESVMITSVRNLSPISINVGMMRGSEPIVSQTIEIGGSTDAFNGEFYGAWDAMPEASDSYGPDGCEEGVGSGGTLTTDPDSTIAVVQPRPEVHIELSLACQSL